MGEATNKNIKIEISQDEKESSELINEILTLGKWADVSDGELKRLFFGFNKEKRLKVPNELTKLHNERLVLIYKETLEGYKKQLETLIKLQEEINKDLEEIELKLKKLSEFTVEERILTPEILNAVTESELQQLIEANQDILQVTDNQLFLIKPDGEKELIKTYETQSRKPVKQLRLT